MSKEQERNGVDDRLQGPELSQAFQEAVRDEGIRRELAEDPSGFLRMRGVDLPDGAEVNVIGDPALSRPGPEWTPYAIRMSNCITYYEEVKEKGETVIRKEEICYGIEVIPNPVPGGPHG